MKKLVIALIGILLFSCGQSIDDKARKLIEDELKKTMNDFSSYEFVEMTSPDTVYTYFIDTEMGYELYKERMQFSTDSLLWSVKLEFVSNENEKTDLKNKIEQGVKLVEEYNNSIKDFVPKPKGMSVDFTYRENNELGAKVIRIDTYYFDLEMTKITDSKRY